jgi:hypothetical protein
MITWEKLETQSGDILRAKVPGGWFVIFGTWGAFFYPDPEHKWDGNSLP